jgi:S-adenosylmethionine:tRNA ribosyltransferase-isomerase
MPDSSLILLVSSFAGKELIKNAYSEALEKGYMFLSYGDSMLII